MTDVDMDYLKGWIGRERSVTDVITPRLAASLNAVLDLDGSVEAGLPATPGIHWCLAPDIVPMREIGPDGHPHRGGFLPPIPFPRRMWAGGELIYSGDFRIGDEVVKRSIIDNVEWKSGRSGDLIFVTLSHLYSTPRGLALEERQDIVYRRLENAPAATEQKPALAESADHSRVVKADPVLLFRYSAITFNGHRIHYDHPYVTKEEGYPGLIFHGPLQATLLLNLAAELHGGAVPVHFSFRSVKPLFAGGEISVNGRAATSETLLWIGDQTDGVTMKASARTGAEDHRQRRV
jgi:3-methylfumaryl-CoA hydratase